MKHKTIVKNFKFKELKLNSISKILCLKLYKFMQRLRICEEELEKEYHPNDEMRCPVHFCTGQEVVPASLNILLKKNDFLFSHHRSHGYYLSKNAPMKKLFAEIYGKETGANSELQVLKIFLIQKINFIAELFLLVQLIAVGTAIALKKNKKNNQVLITGFGESATDQGIFWESLNYAALKKLPIIFVCENNNYSTYSPQHERQSGESISKRAKAFGVNSKSIFGNHVSEVFSELKKVVSMTRKGKGPFLLETFTYRYSGHVGPLSDDFQGYRTKKEISFWKKNDTIKIFQEALYKKKYLNNRKYILIKKEIYREIKDSFKFAKIVISKTRILASIKYFY